MNRTWMTVFWIAIVVTALSCAQSGNDAPKPGAEPAGTPPATAEGPDPTVVDSDHYKVEFENEKVRVVRISYGPNEESVMHYHPHHAAIALTDYEAEFTLPDGSTQAVEGRRGEHLFAPAGQHLPGNTSDQPFEFVALELKSGVPGPAGDTGPDATVVDADHYKTEFENEHVRIVRVTYGPGEESVMHYHPDHFAVFLTDHHVEFELPDGTKETIRAGAGEHVFAPAGQHLPKNVGDEPMEVVLVEVK